MVCLPLQGKWQYSNSCVLPLLYRSSSCGVEWANSHSGCSCWAGTGWKAWLFVVRWWTSAVPTCHPCGYQVSFCGGDRRTLSHCRGLLRGGDGGEWSVLMVSQRDHSAANLLASSGLHFRTGWIAQIPFNTFGLKTITIMITVQEMCQSTYSLFSSLRGVVKDKLISIRGRFNFNVFCYDYRKTT